jgi:hypothetical protein
MIRRVCGRHSLVPIDEIQDAERRQDRNFNPFTEGRWYPRLDDLLPARAGATLQEELDRSLAELGVLEGQIAVVKSAMFGNS